MGQELGYKRPTDRAADKPGENHQPRHTEDERYDHHAAPKYQRPGRRFAQGENINARP
jgi:hypothetical protein